ncbi:uncharacterized protein LOC131012126 [Salvia miltiorrhiza]|uniref:uncharacterized protein LOC131012126 n=1 Tax=Salvia miltiorrhiza TaxID=226208 RepID=UPI0025ABEF52|nr:uncharacterized protein LOC131012126 [Salvia miltiorrhiza]
MSELPLLTFRNSIPYPCISRRFSHLGGTKNCGGKLEFIYCKAKNPWTSNLSLPLRDIVGHQAEAIIRDEHTHIEMSSPHQVGSDCIPSRVNKTKKTRRSWTCKEEETMLNGLKELVVQGWKSDNGFRAGYLAKLEDVMKTAFPGTDLKGVPHINSKIAAWKRNYNSLCTMLSYTGAGFNGDHMIDVTNEQWAQICRADRNAELMRYKSWPMFDAWKEVFGKDRATGEHAEDLMDAVNDMYRAGNVAENTHEEESDVNLDEIPETEVVEESVSQTKKGEAAVNGRNKKRKTRDELGASYELLMEIKSTTNERLEQLANRVGYDFDLGKARNEVFAMLGQLEGLSLEQKFDVCELLAYKVERLEIFMGLPAEARQAYAMRILNGSFK